MKVFIAGGTGFVGTQLAAGLLERGHEVTVMGQTDRRPEGLDDAVKVVGGDGRVPGGWQEHAAASDLVINLAGHSIFGRWTDESKKLMRESRLLTTRNIVEAMPGGKEGASLFSTSAVGYYGFHGDEEIEEGSPPGTDFLALLCRDWEEEAGRARTKGIRTVITRFGIVLGKNGGALGQMIPLFKKFVGGPLGDGKQYFSWIHMEDLIGAFLFLLDRPDADGPFNLTAPEPVRNSELAHGLGRVLHRPAGMPAPAFAVKLALGEFSQVVLKGQRVVPSRLLSLGYSFHHPDFDEALSSLF